ncbi:hypothetical protein L6164_023294 [Bauhinia variegata]|uniref:Uncharacterized protein n=1 Tax=Bauhinia variegata TaxID=167791 RepID=A0ACB9MJQ6_BAUVA|nr:hypothetical protein L6164_023294 [Bauhinia variegata]
MASSQLGAVYEEFQPKSELTETPEAHILQIHLPGFTRDQVKTTYQSSNKTLSIFGEKPEGDNKWSRFSEAIPLPLNCEVNRISGKFDMGILTITMPKKVITSIFPKEELKTSKEEISHDPSFGAAYEEFQPKAEKTEDLNDYFLKVYLPGFSKDQINTKYVSSSRVINISGERPIEGGKRWTRFNQAFPVPENFNDERLGAKFDNGILTITMPKRFHSLFAPREEVKTSYDTGLNPLKDAMAEQKPQKVEELILPKPREGFKRSSSLASLEEIDQKPHISSVYEEFQPKSETTENLEAYHIQIYLPGFTKEDVKIKYISSSRVMSIFGGRQIQGSNRWIRVDKAYPVPENCDVERVQGKFDKGILTITMPKKFIPQLLAPKEAKTTQEKFSSPLDKYTAPSLEEARDHERGIASLPSFPQKDKEELVPKPTRLTLLDEQAALRTANAEGKGIDIADIIGKGIQGVACSASSAVKNIGDGTLNGEVKHLLAVVIAALGVHVSYRLTYSGKPYNY